jgi:membrane-associated protein
MDLLSLLLEPKMLIATLGTFGVIAIIFLETGFFFGFFFPGDSLLFTAGFLASKGILNFPILLVGAFLAAVIGDSVGYYFGKKIGPAIFSRENSIFFNRKNISKAQEFYEKHGKKTIILARFIPIVRTFAPIVAGIGNMKYKTFFAFNIIGALIWAVGIICLGYFFGSLIPDAERYVLITVLIIILISAFPALIEIFRHGKKKWNDTETN